VRLPTNIESLYIDFDAFFANVEKQLEPGIRDVPVGVTALGSEYSALITCCYMAKRAGITRGMRVREARKACPDIVIRVARPDVYVDIHNRIVAEVDSHVPVRKVWSIDEVECRLIGREQKSAQTLALNIRDGLLKNIGLYVTPSIGLAPNQFLAKVAAEMEKPSGFVTLRPEDLPGRIAHLKLTKLPGISSNMEVRLNKAGITDIEGFWNISAKHARAIWGSVEGERMWAQLRGYDVARPETTKRMFGHSRVLSGDFKDTRRAVDCLHLLTVKAAYRLRRAGYLAGALSVSFKTTEDKRWSGERRFSHCRDDLTFIRHMKSLYEQGLHELGHPAKLKSVYVLLHAIARKNEVSEDLFNTNRVNPDDKTWDSLMTVMDDLNAKHGKAVLHVGARAKLPGGFAGGKIAFGRVPDKEDFY